MAMLTLVRDGMGGSERYARALTRELSTDDRVLAEAVVPEPARGFSLGVPEVVVSGLDGGSSTGARLRTVARAGLGRQARNALRGADVVHYPFSAPVPRPPGSVPYVQTLHDVQHLDLPHLFSTAERAYRRVMYDRAAHRAAAVITVSEFAKRRAVELLGLDERRVHVAHLGVDSPPSADVSGERDGFVLYPARGWAHKNHGTLVAAVELLRRSDPTVRLVLTGGGLESLGPLPEWVEVRGHVSDEELERLYRRAGVLAFPSLYEGFGLPPLEAMARGCPVAVANAGALPEVCGEAAEYFDPEDPADIAAGIDRARRGAGRRADLGRVQVRRFSWRACADRHIEVFRLLTHDVPR
jgi:glycosyltransferase involved in cell wall biosynthesis